MSFMADFQDNPPCAHRPIAGGVRPATDRPASVLQACRQKSIRVEEWTLRDMACKHVDKCARLGRDEFSAGVDGGD